MCFGMKLKFIPSFKFCLYLNFNFFLISVPWNLALHCWKKILKLRDSWANLLHLHVHRTGWCTALEGRLIRRHFIWALFIIKWNFFVFVYHFLLHLWYQFLPDVNGASWKKHCSTFPQKIWISIFKLAISCGRASCRTLIFLF